MRNLNHNSPFHVKKQKLQLNYNVFGDNPTTYVTYSLAKLKKTSSLPYDKLVNYSFNIDG